MVNVIIVLPYIQWIIETGFMPRLNYIWTDLSEVRSILYAPDPFEYIMEQNDF
jgi:hypothetical protein